MTRFALVGHDSVIRWQRLINLWGKRVVQLPSKSTFSYRSSLAIVVGVGVSQLWLSAVVAQMTPGETLGTCVIGGGLSDTAIQAYINPEVGNLSIAGPIPSNLRSLTDTLDDPWRSAAAGSNYGPVEPWFGSTSAPGSANTFTYREPDRMVAIATTVESVQVPFNSATSCSGGPAATTGFGLSFAATLQDNAPRPASLYNPLDQPGFWHHTGGVLGDKKRNAVRFTFAQPVKSFGAWFGDLETRSQTGGVPAYLRLIDGAGYRIGQDIPIDPQTIDTGMGSTANPQPLDQTTCSSVASDRLGCGNHTSRWVGFIDTSAIARIKQVLVIVGDDDTIGDGDNERLSFIGFNRSSPAKLLLVKRITAINGQTRNPHDDMPLDQLIDSPNSTQDNALNWPTLNTDPARGATTISQYLVGAIAGGNVQSGDEIEYTVYFLNAGGRSASRVRICDVLNQALSPSSDPIQLQIGANSRQTLTPQIDGDRAQVIASTAPIPANCPAPSGVTQHGGVVIVDIADATTSLVGSTGPGTPEQSYGFIRFKVQVR